MNIKTLSFADVGRRVKYTLPFKHDRKKSEQTVFYGMLISYDKTHITILVEAIQKAPIKALPFDLEFIQEKEK